MTTRLVAAGVGAGLPPLKMLFDENKQTRSPGETLDTQLHAHETAALLMPRKISQFLLNYA